MKLRARETESAPGMSWGGIHSLSRRAEKIAGSEAGSFASPLPQAPGARHFGPGDEENRVPLAGGTADPASIAAAVQDDRLMVSFIIFQGAKRAYLDAFGATVAEVEVGPGDKLGFEKERDLMGDRRSHGQAGRLLAIADPSDERRLECPDRVAEPLPLVAVVSVKSFVLR